jgi:hypothetical protein
MRFFSAAILAMAMLNCQTTAKGVPVQPSAKVKEFLGDSILGVLSAPDSVTAVLVEPRGGSTADHMDGFKLLSKPVALTAEQISTLQNAIMDEKTYDFLHSKRHPFDPSVGFQFKKGKDTVNVLVSYYGNLWQFTFSGATTNGAIATLVNADVTANLLVTASAVGGSGLPAVLASTSLDNGALTATALAAGVTIAIVYAGSGTALSIPAVVGSAVIINGATDANGLPASTATDIAAYMSANAPQVAY